MLWESEDDCEKLIEKIMKMKDEKKRQKKEYTELQALLWESQDNCEQLIEKIMMMSDKKKRKT